MYVCPAQYLGCKFGRRRLAMKCSLNNFRFVKSRDLVHYGLGHTLCTACAMCSLLHCMYRLVQIIQFRALAPLSYITTEALALQEGEGPAIDTMHTHTHAHTHAHAHTHTHTHIRTHAHAHAHTHKHTCMHIRWGRGSGPTSAKSQQKS
jgi:hypothetical protein